MPLLKEIDIKFQSETGAPTPILIGSESRLFLLFYNQDWFEETNKIKVVQVEFKRCIIHKSGSPNDEIANGHKYYKLGFRPYSVFQVLKSDWIEEVKKINAVHPRFDDDIFKNFNHYIFSFHDSTFECIAESFIVEGIQSEMKEAILNAAADISINI